jgi:hypothetical protein
MLCDIQKRSARAVAKAVPLNITLLIFHAPHSSLPPPLATSMFRLHTEGNRSFSYNPEAKRPRLLLRINNAAHRLDDPKDRIAQMMCLARERQSKTQFVQRLYTAFMSRIAQGLNQIPVIFLDQLVEMSSGAHEDKCTVKQMIRDVIWKSWTVGARETHVDYSRFFHLSCGCMGRNVQ